MNDRLQLCPLGDAEGQGVLGMGMDDGHHVRPRRKDRRMNKALEIKAAAVVANRPAVEVELDDVLGADQLRCQRAGDQEMAGVVRMAHADMAVGVDHLLPGEDPVGDDEVLHQGVESAHGRSSQK